MPLLGKLDDAEVPVADRTADVPWASLVAVGDAPSRTTPDGEPLPDTRTAADWYDPTAETVVRLFNASGFITTPSPAPVNRRTGAVPFTNAEVCETFGHPERFGSCPRCGVPL